MFNRKHHQLIALALQGLNAPKLAEHQCYFGLASSQSVGSIWRTAV